MDRDIEDSFKKIEQLEDLKEGVMDNFSDRTKDNLTTIGVAYSGIIVSFILSFFIEPLLLVFIPTIISCSIATVLWRRIDVKNKQFHNYCKAKQKSIN